MSSSLRRTTTDEHYDDTILNRIAAEAVITWHEMTARERGIVRMGIFPRERMEALEARFPEVQRGDRSRLCAVALMDCAKADGGMRG